MIRYFSGAPVETGTYAARVKMKLDFQSNVPLFEDLFLFYDAQTKRWSYPLSDQYYRDEVDFWLGPLQRKMN